MTQPSEDGIHPFIARYIEVHELQSRSARSELDRLHCLIDDASGRLLQSFTAIKVFAHRRECPMEDGEDLQTADLAHAVNSAISALQFQDMATQLIEHAAQRITLIETMTSSLRRLPEASVEELTDTLAASSCTQRAGPVEQSCMDGGSVELF